MAMGMVSFTYTYSATTFIHNATIQVFLAIVAALVTGAIIGWLNGFIIVKFGIPSLVVTIGTQFLWSGAALVLTQGANFSLLFIKTDLFLQPVCRQDRTILPHANVMVGFGRDPGWVLLNRHRFGAHVYLIGDNINSAELMGVNTKRTRIQVFMLVGVVSAFAGILASFTWLISGRPWEMVFCSKPWLRSFWGYIRLRRHRYHTWNLSRSIHHWCHRSCNRCRWSDRILD